MAQRGKTQQSKWEWVAFALSALLVLGTVAFLLHQEFGQPDTPPEIVLTVDTVVAQRGGYLVQLRARNRGTETAAAVHVHGELQTDADPEISETVVDYVPGGGERPAGLFFRSDPRRFPLTLRALGYTEP